MPAWLDYLDTHFPDWRVVPPPGSAPFFEEGEQALTNSTPAAESSVDLASLTTLTSQVAVFQSVGLQGDRVQVHDPGGNTIYEAMQPTSIRGKLYWDFAPDVGTFLKSITYTDGRKGFQRLRTLDARSGVPAIVLPPGRTATLSMTMVDPSVGETFTASGAVLTATIAGYLITLPKLKC